jgi:hypothetical protein
MNHVIGKVGHRYDSQNILDLGLMLLPGFLNPFKKHTLRACLGKCNEFEVICSGLIAKAFQKVGYPIVPALCPATTEGAVARGNPYGSRLMMRHYSQIMQRDFDLSPNFEIIKFNIIGHGIFNYKTLWAETIFEPVPAGQGCNTAPRTMKLNDGLIPASRTAPDAHRMK